MYRNFISKYHEFIEIYVLFTLLIMQRNISVKKNTSYVNFLITILIHSYIRYRYNINKESKVIT